MEEDSETLAANPSRPPQPPSPSTSSVPKSPEENISKQPPHQVPPFSGFPTLKGDFQMFHIMYPGIVPGFIPLQNQEHPNKGDGIYVIPVLPSMGPMAGFPPTTLIPHYLQYSHKGGGSIDLDPCLTHTSTMKPTLAPMAVERSITTRSAASALWRICKPFFPRLSGNFVHLKE